MSTESWPRRLCRTLPDRPLRQTEILDLEAADGPFQFTSWATIITSNLEWREYGFLAAHADEWYGIVYGDHGDWRELGPFASKDECTRRVEEWANEQVPVAIGPVRMDGGTQ